MRIRGARYRKHSVTLIKVTVARGRETTTETVVDDAYVGTIRIVDRTVSGDQQVEKTIVILDPDEDIDRGDKIKIGDVTMPVKSITRPRFVGASPNHLEVILD